MLIRKKLPQGIISLQHVVQASRLKLTMGSANLRQGRYCTDARGRIVGWSLTSEVELRSSSAGLYGAAVECIHKAGRVHTDRQSRKCTL